jgi:hypothetical protein
MDTSRERENLVQADRHIAEAKVRIDELKQRILLSEQQGHSITTSLRTLHLFESTMRLMIDHRKMILRELGKIEAFHC